MMKIEEIRKKNIKDLNINLLDLLREKFNLNIQIKNNQLKKTHLIRKIRRDIARIKTVIHEKYYEKEK